MNFLENSPMSSFKNLLVFFFSKNRPWIVSLLVLFMHSIHISSENFVRSSSTGYIRNFSCDFFFRNSSKKSSMDSIKKKSRHSYMKFHRYSFWKSFKDYSIISFFQISFKGCYEAVHTSTLSLTTRLNPSGISPE